MSIALRMTIWYALSAFTLIVVATGLLYWVLVESLYQEDVRDLADNLNNARLLLLSSQFQKIPDRLDRRPAWAPSRQPEIYLRLLDQSGHTLVETPGMADQLPTPSAAQLKAASDTEGEKLDVISPSGLPFLTLIVRVPGRSPAEQARFMQVAMNREHDEYLLARYRERLWLVLGVSLVLCSLVGYLIARSGMRPIERIAGTAERIGSTTLHERINPLGLPAELAGLAETFNNMLDRLEASFQRISQFSDDVAHELRTPINNLRGEIEVALGKERSGEDYREVLGSSLEECNRLSGLIQSLLFLARTEGASQPIQGERVDIGTELHTVQEFYEPAAADGGVALRVSAPVDLSACVDRALFQQAVGNLVSNAIAHTQPGGQIDITATAKDRYVIVSVKDTGCGIPAEHLPHVFERFYRVDTARANSAHHVGLGLAVVKGIVTRHGGTVHMTSEIGHGTCVTLAFPQ